MFIWAIFLFFLLWIIEGLTLKSKTSRNTETGIGLCVLAEQQSKAGEMAEAGEISSNFD